MAELRSKFLTQLKGERTRKMRSLLFAKSLSITAFILLIIPFSQAQNFVHNIDTAKTIAIEESKPILMIFSGSDWCKPCIQLREKVLGNIYFTDFSDKKLVLLELDFPYRRKNKLPKEQRAHNEKLAEQYNPKGQFPMMVLLKSDGSLIEEIPYNNILSGRDYVRLIETKM